MNDILFGNNNRTVIKKLATARLKQNPLRNNLIGIVIFIAAAIMAFVSCYAYNITHEYATETSYQSIYVNLSQENISLLKADPRVEKVGLYQSVGMTNKEQGVTMGLVCSDEITMELSNITLIDGQMPKAANELLVEKGYMDALNLNVGVGDTIPITYRNQASRVMETKEFLIVGLIRTTAESDTHRIAYNGVVSPNLVLEDAGLSLQPMSAMIAVHNAHKYSNQEIKELVQSIGADCQIATDQIQVNNLNIDSNNASGQTVFTVLIIGLILLGACSLVVYNIFYISVMSNVTAFGQLRTIGTTKKQVKRIISIEGTWLALRFIPFGSGVGCMLSFLIDKDAFQLIPDLLITLFAGIVTLMAVKLSVRKPAKIATAISPIEAFNYNAYTNGKKTKKKNVPLTPCSLAFMNLSRNKKKSMLTFLSLALSGMLFVGLSSLLTSLDPVERAKQSFPYEGAYVIELNKSLITPTTSITDLQMNNPLTDELYNDLLLLNGVSGIVCQQEVRALLDGTETTIWSMGTEDYLELNSRLVGGMLPSADAVGKDTLIVNISSPELEYLQKSYDVGDMVSFSIAGQDGLSNTSYVVSAIISDRNNASSFILPESEMMEIATYNTNSAFVVQSELGYSIETENAILSLTSTNDTLRLKTLNDMTLQYKSVFSTISIAVYALLAFIAIFSIINLVNTSMTNIIARKKEIGLLRAVGLDSKQLHHMIGIENTFLTMGSFLFSTGFGLIIGKGICSIVQEIPGFSFVKYTFPTGVVLSYLLVIVLLQILLTKWANRYSSKSSVIEQIRTAN